MPVYTAVTRRDADTHEPLEGWLPEERITLAEALRAYTAAVPPPPARGRARAAGPGHVRRYRRAGPEPLRAGPEDIQQAKVQATYVAGKKAYER